MAIKLKPEQINRIEERFDFFPSDAESIYKKNDIQFYILNNYL